MHAAYWKYAVWRRLTGEKRGSFPSSGSDWFRQPKGDPNPAEWRAAVALLVAQHRRLRTAVEHLRATDLARAPGGGVTSIETLVRGIAAHDLYHAGQIQLLKRLSLRFR